MFFLIVQNCQVQVLMGSSIGNAVKTGRARRCDLDLRFSFVRVNGEPFQQMLPLFQMEREGGRKGGGVRRPA